jgi:hypothetical protein
MTAFSPFPPVQKTDPERVLWVDLPRSPRGPYMTAICVKPTAGVDVKRPVAESHLVAAFSAAEIGVTDTFVAAQSVKSMCLSKTMTPFSLRTILYPRSPSPNSSKLYSPSAPL